MDASYIMKTNVSHLKVQVKAYCPMYAHKCSCRKLWYLFQNRLVHCTRGSLLVGYSNIDLIIRCHHLIVFVLSIYSSLMFFPDNLLMPCMRVTGINNSKHIINVIQLN